MSVVAAPAAAQDRSPAERQTLQALARTLGEAHALKAVCEGKSDQTWRNRMARITELEAAEEAFRARLVESFNVGFLDREAAHTGCDADAKAAVRTVARRGRDLAAGLAGGRMETAAAR
jgi:uncharacterized protein (TIGR02301 family)